MCLSFFHFFFNKFFVFQMRKSAIVKYIYIHTFTRIYMYVLKNVVKELLLWHFCFLLLVCTSFTAAQQGALTVTLHKRGWQWFIAKRYATFKHTNIELKSILSYNRTQILHIFTETFLCMNIVIDVYVCSSTSLHTYQTT